MPVNWKIAGGALASIVCCILYLLRSRFKQGQGVGAADQKLADEKARIGKASNQEVADDLNRSSGPDGE